MVSTQKDVCEVILSEDLCTWTFLSYCQYSSSIHQVFTDMEEHLIFPEDFGC